MTKGFASYLGIGFAVVISVAALYLSATGPEVQAPTDLEAGGQRAGLQEYKDGIKAGQVSTQWFEATLPVGTDQVVLFQNTSGKDVVVNYGEVAVRTGQTSASAYLVNVIATSTREIANVYDFTSTLAEGKSALIQGVMIATSTTASTTNSVYAAAQSAAGGVNGNGAIVVPDGWYVIGYMKWPGNAFTGLACLASGTCPAATSTARGFNPIFRAHVHGY